MRVKSGIGMRKMAISVARLIGEDTTNKTILSMQFAVVVVEGWKITVKGRHSKANKVVNTKPDKFTMRRVM